MDSVSLGCTNNIAVCITSIGILCLLYIFLIPFMVISTLKFYRIRHYGGISARYPTIIIAASIYNILHIFIIDQYMLISNGIAPSHLLWLTHMMQQTIFPPFLFIIPLVTILRIWLINFDIKHALHKSTLDWQMLLASTVDTEDWYSRNKSKWGNWKWLLKIFVFTWCLLFICTIAPIIVSYSNNAIHISQTVYMIFLCLLIIPMVVIWCKIPYFEDIFCIKQEIQILLKCDFVCGLLYFGISHWAEPHNIFELIQRVIVISIHFLQVYMSVYWVIIKQRTLNEHKPTTLPRNKALNNMNNCCWLYRTDAEFDRPFRMSIVNARSRSKSIDRRTLTNQRLFNVLVATDIGMNCLFEHLKREFCFESLLFFIEIVQWIYSVTNQSFDNFDIRPLPDIQFEFAAVIPISCINNTDEDWYHKIDQIYNKYIGPSGEYQVNLPWNIQNEYYNLLRLFGIKRQIEGGTYAPKLKRKAHHIKTKTFWNRHTSKSSKKSEDAPTVKYRKSADIYDDIDEELDHPIKSLPMGTTQSCNTILEHNTEIPTMHKKNDTVDLGTIRHKKKDGDPRKVQTFASPLIFERTGTLIEQESVPVDTDSEDDDDGDINIDMNMDILRKPISLKSWKDPSIEYSDESNDDKLRQIETSDHDWNAAEMVLMHKAEDEHTGDDDVETPIPLDTTVMNDGNTGSHNLDDVCHDVLLNHASSLEYDKSASQTVTFESNMSKVIRIAPTEIKKESTDAQLDDIFQDVLNQPSEATIDVKGRAVKSTVSVDIKAVEEKEEEEEEKHEGDHPMMPLSSISPQGLVSQRSLSKGTVLSKLTALIPMAFSPSIANNVSRSHASEMDQNDDDDEDNEIDETEQKQMDEAKRITVHNFVSLSCRAMYEILKLNYHSVARFKRSIHFKTFEESVNLNELLNQFGDKGC